MQRFVISHGDAHSLTCHVFAAVLRLFHVVWMSVLLVEVEVEVEVEGVGASPAWEQRARY